MTYPTEDCRHFAFTIPMTTEQRDIAYEAFQYLNEQAEEASDDPNTPPFETQCPDATERLSTKALLVAREIYANVTISATRSFYDFTELAAEKVDKGLYVEDHVSEWGPLDLAVGVAKALQDRFKLNAFVLEYNDYNDTADCPFGGGAVFFAPGRSPEYFNTAQWGTERMAEHAKNMEARQQAGAGLAMP